MTRNGGGGGGRRLQNTRLALDLALLQFAFTEFPIAGALCGGDGGGEQSSPDISIPQIASVFSRWLPACSGRNSGRLPFFALRRTRLLIQLVIWVGQTFQMALLAPDCSTPCLSADVKKCLDFCRDKGNLHLQKKIILKTIPLPFLSTLSVLTLYFRGFSYTIYRSMIQFFPQKSLIFFQRVRLVVFHRGFLKHYRQLWRKRLIIGK